MVRRHCWQVGHLGCFLGYKDVIGEQVGRLPASCIVVVVEVGTEGDLTVFRLNGPGYVPHSETVWPEELIFLPHGPYGDDEVA